MTHRYAWTPTGNMIHITDDGEWTRCGRRVAATPPTRRELDYFTHCKRCEK